MCRGREARSTGVFALETFTVLAVALVSVNPPTVPGAAGADKASEQPVPDEMIERYREASDRADDFLLHGSFYLAARECTKLIPLAKQIYGADHWRVREPELQLEAARNIEGLPADKYVEALRAQSDLKRALSRLEPNPADAIMFAESARRGWERLAAESAYKYEYHYSTALALIGKAQQFQGGSESALRAYQQRLPIVARLLGNTHPAVIAARSNLGRAIADSPRFYEAETLLRTAYDAANECYEREGVEDQHIVGLYVLCCRNVAGFLHCLGELGEAERFYRRALDAVQSRATMRTKSAVLLTDLAQIRLDEERPQEALGIASRALESAKAAYGNEPYQYALVLLQVAVANVAAGDPARADELICQAEAVFRRLDYDEGNWPSAYTTARGGLCLKNGQTAEAQQIFEPLLVRSESLCGPDHPVLIRPLRRLAEIKAKLGRQAEAEMLQRRANQIEAKRDEYKRTRSLAR